MGLIRRYLHTEDINRVADQLRALAHPARLEILRHISQSNDCICTDLSKDLKLAQATISQHLKVLKDAGVITGTITGNSVCYCIDQNFLRAFKSEFLEFLEELGNGPCSENC